MRAVKHIAGIKKENILDIILSEEESKNNLLSKLNLSSQIIENDSDLPSHLTLDIETRLIIIPNYEIDFVIDNLADKLACNVLRIHSGNLGRVLLREHLQGLVGGLSLNG